MTVALKHCPECGCLLANPRSISDHRRFFGVIGKAYKQWPESYDFQPRDAEHLRGFLLVTVGYFDVQTIDLREIITSKEPSLLVLARLAVEASVAAAHKQSDYVVTRPRDVVVEIIKPRSLNFHALSQKQFNPIREAVEDLIEAIIGVSVDQLLREQAA